MSKYGKYSKCSFLRLNLEESNIQILCWGCVKDFRRRALVNLFTELLQVLVELMRLVGLFIRFLFMVAWAFLLLYILWKIVSLLL